MVGRYALNVAALVWASAFVARAADVGVRLRVRCSPEGTTPSEISRILIAELAPIPLELALEDRPPAPGTVDLELRACTEGSARAVVRAVRGESVRERIVDLGDVALDARDRALALALASTAREDDTDRARRFEPVVSAEPSASASAPLPTRPSPPRDHASARDTDRARPRSQVSALGRYVFAPSALFAGAEIALYRELFGLAVGVLASERTAALGTIRVLGAFAAPTYDVPLLPAVVLRARAEVGLAVSTGSAQSGATSRTVDALHAAIAAGPALEITLRPGFGLSAFVSGGYASSLVAGADGRDVLGLSGAFCRASLGLSSE